MASTLSQQSAATAAPQSSIDAAMGVVASAERVSMKELPDGGIAFDIEPGPRNLWAVPVVCTVLGLVCIVGGYLMHVYNPGLPQGYAWFGPWKLMMLGALNVALGPMILLIFVMQGPPKKATLEARPGSLRADRSIAGDHVVSSYAAGEVECLLVEDGSLFATTRKGNQPLVMFGDRDVNRAIATLLASRLWQPEEIMGGPARGTNQWFILPHSRVAAADAGAGSRR